MSRRPTLVQRCVACRMHLSLCICALVPLVQTRTRLLIVMHQAERRKSTNTGQLAAACLPNSEILIRGHEEHRNDAVPISVGTTAIVLYPAEDAVSLAALAPTLTGPLTLVVPDGNWRQAAKVRRRVAGLGELPCVTLPEAAPSRYRLRAEAHLHGLSTLEAIARALGILEGRAVEDALLFPFRAMVERTLWARGQLDGRHVTGGIPAGAQRHDPVSGL